VGILLTVVALFAAEPDLSALTPAEVAARGEAAFAEGVRRRDEPDAARKQFRLAVTCFEELRNRGASNATLYRNLGSSYLLADDLPRAILSYRRGLQLVPGDHDLTVALEAARGRVDYAAGSRLGQQLAAGGSRWPAAVVGHWLIGGAALLYAAACVGATRWLMTRRRTPLAAAFGAFLAAGLLTALAVRGLSGKAEGPLVVIAEDGVLLRRGDSLSYPPRFEAPLNRGVEGHLLTSRGKWLQIELAGGEAGWVLREYALVDADET
jgi:hypothetical protein